MTPVSGGSEIEFNTNDATAGSTADCDVTVTEDIESSLVLAEDEDTSRSIDLEKPLSPMTTSISSEPGISPIMENRIEFKEKSSYRSDPMIVDHHAEPIRLKRLGSDKWCSKKEKFLDIKSPEERHAGNKSKAKSHAHGAIVIKEGYIEPPKINRISKSFHGQSNSSGFLDAPSNSHRRASDVAGGVSTEDSKKISRRNSNIEKTTNLRQFVTQKSLNENLPRNPRFTTTLVDEAEHAAFMGISTTIINPNAKSNDAFKK